MKVCNCIKHQLQCQQWPDWRSWPIYLPWQYCVQQCSTTWCQNWQGSYSPPTHSPCFVNNFHWLEYSYAPTTVLWYQHQSMQVHLRSWKKLAKGLIIFHMRCLRKILNVKWKNITNNEILERANSQPLNETTTERRLRLAGYILPEERNLKTGMTWIPSNRKRERVIPKAHLAQDLLWWPKEDGHFLGWSWACCNQSYQME